jgi:nucleoside-diphosphate-sugar epimerase
MGRFKPQSAQAVALELSAQAMKILVTGGCGYKGSVLVPALLKDGHSVIVVDTQWFGSYLEPHSRLKNIKADIRDLDRNIFQGVDVVIHLANIANDPAVELNPSLSWEVNVLAGMTLIEAAKAAGVKQFIYASSGSVYGVKEEEKVTEDLELVPISVYNKTKMVAERVFLSYQDSLKVHCLRPATVCGVSPRMRLDVSVNLLTYQALTKGTITVFGGDQTRPNVHIEDIIDVYRHFICHRDEIDSGCYNVGFENITIKDIANSVLSAIGGDIVVQGSNDPRSYRQDSTKLLSTGFVPKKCVLDAITEIKSAFDSGILNDDESCYTVKRMRSLELDK